MKPKVQFKGQTKVSYPIIFLSLNVVCFLERTDWDGVYQSGGVVFSLTPKQR